MMNLPLPSETREYLGKDKTKVLKSDNLGLVFSKYFYSWPADWQIKEEQNKEFRKDLESEFSSISFRKENDFLTALNIRQTKIVEGLQSSSWHIESFNATTDSRLIIGLGSESVVETGMTLHPLYGFPYLPGSGLKGVARAYAELAYDFPDDDTKRRKLHEIFGSEDKDPRNVINDSQQGRVFFMDGLPVSFPKLDLDIMNPHYGEYYQGDKPPADYLNPVPVTFLTVAEGQPFSFALFSREERLAKEAKEWLLGGLTQLGAGGKTNVGYGYFRIDPASEKIEKQTVSAVKEDTSLASKLKTVKNGETFSDFIKNIGSDKVEELKCISFKGMESVINIGTVGVLEASEVSNEIRKVIAGKMLEIIRKKKNWNDEKNEKYRKLRSMAGLDPE